MPKPTKNNLVVICHNIRSLYNVGSIFRTADAFGISKIYLTGYTGRPDNPVHKNKLTKVALGAESYVSWEYHKSPSILIKKFKTDGVKIVALENNLPKGIKLKKVDRFIKQPLALVLGQEREGINKNLLKLCDSYLEIPMVGKKESLNVSVAFGVAAYVIYKNYSRKKDTY